MEDITQQDHHKNIPKIIILSILLIAIMAITLITLRRTAQNNQQQTNSTMNSTTMPQQQVENQKVDSLQLDVPRSVQENENIVLTIKVDSKNRDITAFDMLVNYDPAGLSYVKTEALVTGFNVYDYNNGNLISVTGVKSLTNKSPQVFTLTPVLKLTFKPLKKGSFNFSIPSQVGSEKTQLVDNNSQVIEAAEIQTTVTVN